MQAPCIASTAYLIGYAHKKRGGDNSNWNLFTGHIEYDQNFLMGFRNPYTIKRFEAYKFHSNMFRIHSLIIITSALWILDFLFAKSFNLLIFLIGCLLLALSYSATTCLSYNLLVRHFFFFLEFFLQDDIKKFTSSQALHFLGFSSLTFISSNLI